MLFVFVLNQNKDSPFAIFLKIFVVVVISIIGLESKYVLEL